MLNEDKIKLMTGIAMFEKREGKKIFPVNRYFKSDYVGSHMLRSFLFYSLSFALCVVVWALYSVEQLLNTVSTDELIELAKKIGLFYAVGLVVYLAITFWVYAKRYDYANKGAKVYLAKMRRLNKRYVFQRKTKELAKEGGRHDKSPRI